MAGYQTLLPYVVYTCISPFQAFVGGMVCANEYVHGCVYPCPCIHTGTVREMLGLHSYDIVEVNPTQHSDYLVLSCRYWYFQTCM